MFNIADLFRGARKTDDRSASSSALSASNNAGAAAGVSSVHAVTAAQAAAHAASANATSPDQGSNAGQQDGLWRAGRRRWPSDAHLKKVGPLLRANHKHRLYLAHGAATGSTHSAGESKSESATGVETEANDIGAIMAAACVLDILPVSKLYDLWDVLASDDHHHLAPAHPAQLSQSGSEGSRRVRGRPVESLDSEEEITEEDFLAPHYLGAGAEVATTYVDFWDDEAVVRHLYDWRALLADVFGDADADAVATTSNPAGAGKGAAVSLGAFEGDDAQLRRLHGVADRSRGRVKVCDGLSSRDGWGWRQLALARRLDNLQMVTEALGGACAYYTPATLATVAVAVGVGVDKPDVATDVALVVGALRSVPDVLRFVRSNVAQVLDQLRAAGSGPLGEGGEQLLMHCATLDAIAQVADILPLAITRRALSTELARPSWAAVLSTASAAATMTAAAAVEEGVDDAERLHRALAEQLLAKLSAAHAAAGGAEVGTGPEALVLLDFLRDYGRVGYEIAQRLVSA